MKFILPIIAFVFTFSFFGCTSSSSDTISPTSTVDAIADATADGIAGIETDTSLDHAAALNIAIDLEYILFEAEFEVTAESNGDYDFTGPTTKSGVEKYVSSAGKTTCVLDGFAPPSGPICYGTIVKTVAGNTTSYTAGVVYDYTGYTGATSYTDSNPKAFSITIEKTGTGPYTYTMIINGNDYIKTSPDQIAQ